MLVYYILHIHALKTHMHATTYTIIEKEVISLDLK